MNIPFKIVAKARGKEGAFHLSISAIAVTIAGVFSIFPTVYGVLLPWYIIVLLASIGITGLWFSIKAIVDIRKAREWEFRVDDNRMVWTSRDRTTETVEGEISLRDIRALIYQTSDGTPGEYLLVEFIDGSVKELPIVGIPSKASLFAFIAYWRDAHDEIPIRNLEKA